MGDRRPHLHPAAGGAGFTLIELLIVVIIIAVLAAIAIPTYLGARSKAQDTAALNLVRNALTIVESTNIDSTGGYAALTAADLQSMEPNVVWRVSAADLVDPTVPTITAAVTALAKNRQMDYYPQAFDTFDIASTSESGNKYGIQVKASGAFSVSYIKVKLVEGSSTTGW